MSYRTFKRMLGETSLERKCRLLLGGGIFLLILISFFLYGYQTEKLVWEQTQVTGQLLVNPILLKRHWQQTHVEPGKEGSATSNQPQPLGPPAPDSGDFFWRTDDPTPPQTKRESIEEILPKDVSRYTARFLRPNTDTVEYIPRNGWEREAFRTLQEGNEPEVTKINHSDGVFEYLGAVKMRQSCLECHPTVLDKKLGYQSFKEGDLMAAVKIDIPLQKTQLAVNVNRAILISFALGSAILAMLFAYITVRYVIVKPVAHLKDVAEEIASGNLAIRSSIQTGDEFEQLSHAFNRMLRSLVTMQDELRRVNTDLDRKLDELARANMALFEMNRLKSEFLATISHELRTPLNSILGFSDLLADVSALNGKQVKWVGNIQSSGKLLLQLINDILDLAKLEAGKMHLQLEEFSLRDLVEGQIQMIQPLAEKKNIALVSEVDSAVPILYQDPGKLQQILNNLISNAVKFTPEGGQIIIRCQPDRAHVKIAVIDNGVGIAADDQKLIFEKFRQSESSLTRVHGGTGLGLSIVRELTKLLGGDEVSLDSELGRGSTFTISIPMKMEESDGKDLELRGGPLEIGSERLSEVRYFSTRPTPISDH